jgi:glyoxylase-like metal-dependent hydrolase (beta-lactamase superfamily II)
LSRSASLPFSIQVIERGWLSSNIVVLTGDNATALIDSGYASHSAQTVALVQSTLGTSTPDLLLNTHLHSDHCGGNAALQAMFPSLKTLIPPGQSRFVSNWDPVALSYQPTGQICPQFSFQGLLKPGTEILLGDLVWEIHSAAGHDPHSLVFFQRDARILVSADALWENGFGIVFPELEGESAFDEVSSTLDLIEDLLPLTVIPGHGAPFVYSNEIMSRARDRLAAFVSNPVKHARHAAKVLLKFKLLEVQSQSAADFKAWALQTPYLELVRSRFFFAVNPSQWVDELIAELVLSNAARRVDDNICNI